jgi:hypothetical protein
MTVRAAEAMVGREAAVHIMLVLITSRGVVAAAANAPAAAPIAKSSCGAAARAHQRPRALGVLFFRLEYTLMRIANMNIYAVVDTM